MSQPGVADAQSAPDPLLPIGDDHVRFAIDLVDSSGIVERHDEWVAEQRKGPAGRKRSLSYRALLIGSVVSTLVGKAPQVKSFTDVLYLQISPKMRRELGVPEPPDPGDALGWANLYRNMGRQFQTFLAPIDPSHLPKNRCLPPDEYNRRADESRGVLSDAEWAARFDRLEWVCNQLIEVSLAATPRSVRRHLGEALGVDATLVPAHSRGVRHKRDESGHFVDEVFRTPADPDADWYRRDRGGEQGKAEWTWGYEVTLLIAGPTSPRPDDICPSFVYGMSALHQPGVNPGYQAARALQNLRDRGHEHRFVVGDKAYAQALPENYALPLRWMGFEPIHDYKKDQLGPQGTAEGFTMIEGGLYCPCIPEVLANATKDYDAGRIDETTWRARLAERDGVYRSSSKERPDSEGSERRQCPAAGPSPRVSCEIKPRSVQLRRGRGRAVVVPDATTKQFQPKCCSQQTVTIPPEDFARLRQELPFHSTEWENLYPPLRARTEGMNGMLKDGAHEALDDPQRRRVHGVAAQSFFTALLNTSVNLRVAAGVRKKLNAARRTRARRRTSRPISSWRPTPSSVVEPRAQAPPDGAA
jgi:hypothetical protein